MNDDLEMLGVVRAPDFDLPGLTWFNTEYPLSLDDLRGRLVILDFWTYCCINCHHVLSVLQAVEESFPEEVVIIGVHSPKFTAEQDPDNVRKAIQRLQIYHPVIHDPERILWDHYAVRAWPTLVFISPEGKVIGMHAGEPEQNQLLRSLNQVLENLKIEGLIDPTETDIKPEPMPRGRFCFPGKIRPLVVDGEPGWVLADAGHNQIVLLNDQGEEWQRFGSGTAGFQDGPGERAMFNNPQGVVAVGNKIYIADTGNHALRCLDLDLDQVVTLAGNGQRGAGLPSDPQQGLMTALASPWDVVAQDNNLYFANAGTHQIGAFDLRHHGVWRIAGTGAENIVDGMGNEALLAQPSGICLSIDGERLFFADSETSAIRAVELSEGHEVRTLVGSGLFDFGHLNGRFDEAQLQHPLAMTLTPDGNLIVADSYNNILRHLDLMDQEIDDLETIYSPDGTFVCQDKICRPLNEPAGLYMAGQHRLLVVDTNNHRIVEYHLKNRTSRNWAI